jgi:tRNA(adenine34) deaminase
MSSSVDEAFMRLALKQARLGDTLDGAGEVGCVITKDGELAAAGYNEVHLRNDPTAHAEVVTLRKLGEKIGTTDFSGYTLYVTLQPCSMCAAACIWAKINRIVYGATRNSVHCMYFDAKHHNASELIADAYRDDIQIEGGVLARECAELYYKPEENPPLAKQENR